MNQSLENQVDVLKNKWLNENILFSFKSVSDIVDIAKNKGIKLPHDFIVLYKNANGMDSFYPNYTDKEGFLFYPVEKLICHDEEVEWRKGETPALDDVWVFAEYMHKSWWYGFRVLENESYEIGIIPSRNVFKYITNSLSDFINLYIHDDNELYNF